MEILNFISGYWDKIFLTLVIAVVTIAVARLIKIILKRELVRISRTLGVDETTYALVRRLIVAFVYLIGFVAMLSLFPSLRDLSTALFAGAGFAGIIVGFAAKDAFSNIVSGLFLAIFHPFRVNDYVMIGNEYGQIVDITLRDTVIKRSDNTLLLIPNSIVSNQQIINYTEGDPKIIWNIDVNVTYDSDIDKAKKLMIEEAKTHPEIMIIDNLPEVTTIELGDFAIKLRLSFWIKNRQSASTISGDIQDMIKKRFDREGIKFRVR